MQAYSSEVIAQALSQHRITITRRANRESWPRVRREGRGGGWVYPLEGLPRDVRNTLVRSEARETTPAVIQAQQSTPIHLDLKRKDKAAARLALVDLYLDWLRTQGKGTSQRQAFIDAYHAGCWPQLLEVLGKTSWKTLERWKVAGDRGGLVAVADKRGLARAGQRALTDAQREILVRMALQPTAPTVSAVFREANKILAFEGHQLIESERTARRFLMEDFFPLHFGEWVYTRHGAKAWNDKCAFFITRDYSLIGVGDILVADGHVLNFEIQHPWTGKATRMELVVWYDMASNMPCGWEILPTENTQCIASAFRRACITLGAFPKVAYLDNGRAFRSKYFNGQDLRQTRVGGLFRALGVQTLFAWPYHGQSKTVERFFGTFSELENWVPSSTGSCIAKKPPRMMRGERVHRDIYEKSAARPLTLVEAHMAVAMWFDEYSSRPQRGHLNGRSPIEAFLAGRNQVGLGEQDLLKLRDLMLHTTVRNIKRNGVPLLGQHYYAPELYSRKHEVVVKYDPWERDEDGHIAYVLVEDTQGVPICRAEKVRGVHPAARILGTDQHKTDLQTAIELRKVQEAGTARICRTMLAKSVLPDTDRRMAQVAREQEAPREIPVAALPAARVERIDKARVRARQAQAAAPSYTPPAEVRSIVSELDKYEYLFGIHYREGLELTESDLEWMTAYEASDEYQAVAAGRYDRLRSYYTRKQSNAHAS